MSKFDHTADTLTEIASELRKKAARFQALAKAMESDRVNRISIDNHKMMHRGMDAMDNFLDSGQRSLRDAVRAKQK